MTDNTAGAGEARGHKHPAHPATTATTGTPATPHKAGGPQLDSVTVAMTAVGFMVIAGTVLWALVCRALLRYIRRGKGKGYHVST